MNDKRVEVGGTLGDLGWRGALEMFLFVLSGLWILVFEDEVDLGLSISNSLQNASSTTYLVCGTALVGAKHDDIRRGVGKFIRV